MTEEEAKAWLIASLDVPRETLARIEDFIKFLNEEAQRQNLVAASTLEHVWFRHIVDSAQLLRLAPTCGDWLDLGTGAGFPGLIVAALGRHRVTLVESRRKRVGFLEAATDLLGVRDRTTIIGGRAETAPSHPYDIISARAFAPIERLFPIGMPFSTLETVWVLPKGRSAQAELDAAKGTWQGAFRIEPSVTDPDSAILVAERVRPKEQR